MTYLKLLLTFCLFASFFIGAEEKAEHSVMCLIEQKDNIFLVRGKYPIKAKKISFDHLREQLKDCLYQQGISLDDDFHLFSISFLNTFAESKKCQVESQWFCQHADNGYLWRYPLFGSLCNPCYLPSVLRKAIFKTDPDGLRHLIGHLKCLMEMDYPKDEQLVIYLHCNAGKDRTGEATACYLMEYHHYSYHEAMLLNEQIARRPLRLMSQNAIRWYAFYLRDIKLVPTIGTIY